MSAAWERFAACFSRDMNCDGGRKTSCFLMPRLVRVAKWIRRHGAFQRSGSEERLPMKNFIRFWKKKDGIATFPLGISVEHPSHGRPFDSGGVSTACRAQAAQARRPLAKKRDFRSKGTQARTPSAGRRDPLADGGGCRIQTMTPGWPGLRSRSSRWRGRLPYPDYDARLARPEVAVLPLAGEAAVSYSRPSWANRSSTLFCWMADWGPLSSETLFWASTSSSSRFFSGAVSRALILIPVDR